LADFFVDRLALFFAVFLVGRLALWRAPFFGALLDAFFAAVRLDFLDDFPAVFLVAFLVVFPVTFLADFLVLFRLADRADSPARLRAGLRVVSRRVDGVGALIRGAVDSPGEGATGGAAGTGGYSIGRGSIQPDPDQPISI
jgi:hypothetical protein